MKFSDDKLQLRAWLSPLAMAEWIEIHLNKHQPQPVLVSASDGGVD